MGRLVRFFIGWLMVSGVLAQNISETNWYFGNSSQNLVFDLNGRDAYLQNNQATPFGTGGSAVITDQFTGNLLFYSDGEQIFDGGHNLIFGGLSGNSAINVPVATAPVSASPGQYYLFTNSGNGGVNAIEYSIVDANQVGNGSATFPLGDITSINQPTGLANPAEGMIIVPMGDGDTFWLITQDRTNSQYRVTRLDGGGIGATVPYDFTGFAPGAEAAHFSFNADSSYLAVAPKTANRNIRLLDFDPATGVLAFNRVVLNTGYDDGQNESVYDIEWSGNGSKLYLSRFGSAGNEANLYQFDLGDTTELINPVLNNSIFRSYGLQRGLDGRIYHLYQQANGSPFNLGRINQPDSLVDSVAYQPIVFMDDFQGRQFPNFAAGYNFTFISLDFAYRDSCQNNQTKFFPMVDPVPQQYFWDFTGGSVSNDVAPIINFGTPGNYDVSLTATINGISQTTSKTITITNNSAMVDLGNDTTICVDEVLLLDAGDQAVQYLWSTGESSRFISVDTAGTYWVEVLGIEGCPAYDEIVVSEYGVLNTVNNQWYFGERAGIEFTMGTRPITDDNVMDSPEGCASISDINGDLLFYTNGSSIWNKDHLVMQNGDSIGGDSTAIQSALIVPFTDETTLFYVFTSEEVYGTGEYQNKLAVVDMKADSARGRVIVKNIALNNHGTEKLSSSSSTGLGWLVTHEFGNNIFRSNFIRDLGIGPTIYSPIGEVYDETDEIQASGAIKFSNGNQLIASALPRSSGSFLEILDFDQTTGAISNPRLIDLQENDPVYGLEFSQDVSKLYVTTNAAAGSRLIQYDLDSISADNAATDIQSTKFDGYPTGANYGSLQMGPDGVIYMAVDNSTLIGTISSPSGDDAGASFDPEGFDLLTRTSRLGLPNFSQEETSNVTGPGIVANVGCNGQPTFFSGIGRDNSIEEFTWIFGDGTFAIGQDTVHTYAEPGDYTVQLILSNRCDQDTSIYETITISTNTEQPQVPLDTTICDQPIVLSAWPVDRQGYSYTWNTGETTREITVSQQAIINVFITDPNGCQSETVFSFVADGRPEVDLGPDNIYCLGDSPPDLDAGNPAASYEWRVDGAVVGSSMTQAINTSTSGTFDYTVAITDPNTMCIGRDTVQIQILALPDVSITPTPTQGCGMDDGSMELQFNTSGNFDYELQGPTPIGPNNVDGPTTVNHNLMFAPGNYTVNVTNTVTGCLYTEIVQIEDPTMTVTASSTGNCNGQVEITLANTPANFDYEILLDGNTILTGSNQTVFSGLDPGLYSIEITEVGGAGCVETEELDIVAGDEPDFAFDAQQSVCGTSGPVFVTDQSGGMASYSWTGPSIVGSNLSESITVDQAGTYQVTATQTGLCDRVEDIEVTVNPNHGVTAEANGDPCDGEIVLSAVITGGTGPYTYQWSSGQQTQQFTTMTSDNYSVTVRDQATGCIVTSNSVDVTVEELLEVDISATPDCDNNGRIFLEAIPTFEEGVTYSWTGPNGGLSSTAKQITISQEGTYSVTATNPAGTCSATDDFEAILTPITEDDLMLEETANFCSLNAGDPGVELNPGTFNSYEWTRVPDATIISTDPVLYVTQNGTYEVTLYNGFTCTTDRITVLDDCKPVIFAPNAFTPNDDGLNDTFSVIPNPNVQEFNIVIANRWGEPVFKATDQNFKWDGTLEGKKLPQGTYTYRMRFQSTVDSSVGLQDQYGAVVLLR